MGVCVAHENRVIYTIPLGFTFDMFHNRLTCELDDRKFAVLCPDVHTQTSVLTVNRYK
jgi:hypothetical protein